MKEASKCRCTKCGDDHYLAKPQRGSVKLNGVVYFHESLMAFECKRVTIHTRDDNAITITDELGNVICTVQAKK